jgi:RNA 2',3'-cyclic 3'-phosphodiesterase
MGLFIAFDLKEHFEYFSSVQKQLKKAVMSFPDSFHLTLKFLGEVEESKVSSIVEKLSTVEFKPISVHLGPIGVFPDEKYARVVWIGVNPEDEIVRLERDIENVLPNFKKDFDFKPHITLARVKAVEYKERFVENIHGIKIEPRKIMFEKFHLFKSTFSKDGMVYEKIVSFPSTANP